MGAGILNASRYVSLTTMLRLATPPVIVFLSLLLSAPLVLRAQMPKEIVRQAVQSELTASSNDHSRWRYHQEEKVPVHTVSIVVETAYGSIKQKIEESGHPLTPEQTAAEVKRVQSFIHDPGQQQKQRRDGQHDDKSATKLLTMLPEAFAWTVASETPELITLAFTPDPGFDPPDMEAHVMSTMAGEMIVDKSQHRIRTIRGTLSHDVEIGFGLLGKLHQGGTFEVERREIAPGLWQIVETHVHIEGRALFFKTIGQQQDEIKTEFTRVPDSTTLEQAATMLSERKDAGSTSASTR